MHSPDPGASDYVSSLPSSAGHSLYAVDKDEDQDELMGRNFNVDPDRRPRPFDARAQPRVMMPLRGYGRGRVGDMV